MGCSWCTRYGSKANQCLLVALIYQASRQDPPDDTYHLFRRANRPIFVFHHGRLFLPLEASSGDVLFAARPSDLPPPRRALEISSAQLVPGAGCLVRMDPCLSLASFLGPGKQSSAWLRVSDEAQFKKRSATPQKDWLGGVRGPSEIGPTHQLLFTAPCGCTP